MATQKNNTTTIVGTVLLIIAAILAGVMIRYDVSIQQSDDGLLPIISISGDNVACICPNGKAGPDCKRPKPDFCTEEWSPVCGCDGKTYSNSCVALAAHLRSWEEGACDDQ